MRRRANGEGAVYQRDDGRWEAKVSLPDGRRKSVYGATQKEALEKRAEVMRTVARGGAPAVASERQTLGEYLAIWLEGKQSRVRPTTARAYRYLAKHVTPTTARIPLAKLAPQHLEQLYAMRMVARVSPRTVRHLHALLHQALGDAERWGTVSRNAAALARPPKADDVEMKVLTEEQLAKVFAAAEGDRLEALYVLAGTSSMRKGELLALRWSDVDLDNATLQVERTVTRLLGGYTFQPPKTKRSRRRIELLDVAVAALRRHRVRQLQERLAAAGAWDDMDLVFANEVGRPMDGENLTARSWQRINAAAGVPRVRFHDLRHTAITIALANGVHPNVVSEMAGHSSVAFTLSRYGHVIPTMLRQAKEILNQLYKVAAGGRK